MQPITIHNLPVAPREVQLACKASGNPTSPTEMDYCAITYDTGIAGPSYHRYMLIECVDEGYHYNLFAVYLNDDLLSIALHGDDNDAIEVIV